MAITFTNTTTTIPNWSPLHIEHPRSYAYREGEYLVSLYGRGSHLFVISPGLTVSQKADAAPDIWALATFGAQDVTPMKRLPGQAVSGVWRPGLLSHEEINLALGVTASERLSAEQGLQLLLSKLYELFGYIEPTAHGLAAHSHRTRELLILAATEVENYWRYYASKAGLVPGAGHHYKTTDYVRLKDPLHLSEYEVVAKPYANLGSIRPFAGWTAVQPTQSLQWYDAYNKTKHDRENHFSEASLHRCIEAVVACLVLFAVRFSPYSLFNGAGVTASYFNQMFEMKLVNPDCTSFYVPRMTVANRVSQLVCDRSAAQQWTTIPLSL